MVKYKKVYMKEMGYGEQDCILCEMDHGAVACDVHHISAKGMGGCKDKDIEGNLIGLCRGCHSLCHRGVITEEECIEAHKQFKVRYHI